MPSRPCCLKIALTLLVLVFGAHVAFAGDTPPRDNADKKKTKKLKFAYPNRPDELEDQVLDLFDAKCAYAGCHAGATAPQGLDLTEEFFKANLINVKSEGLPRYLRVKPGDANNSYLMGKLRGSASIKGERMPKGSQPLSAQEIGLVERWINSLAQDVKVDMPVREYVQAFPGLTLANLQTAETFEKGAFMYRIAHRFNSPTNVGFDQLFGLDGGASMMTQLAFPFSDKFLISGARSKINATFEVGAKWRLFRQKSDGSVPFSAALYAGVDWATLKGIADPDNPAQILKRTAGDRFAFFAQLPVTRRFGHKLSAAFVPGILLNGNVNVPSEDPLVTMGVGAKYSFNEKYGLFAEIVPIVSGDATALTVGGTYLKDGKQTFSDTFAAGVEIKSGGHVFHILVSNSGGNTTNQYMSGGNFDILDGDFRLGFSIYRILNYPFGF